MSCVNVVGRCVGTGRHSREARRRGVGAVTGIGKERRRRHSDPYDKGNDRRRHLRLKAARRRAAGASVDHLVAVNRRRLGWMVLLPLRRMMPRRRGAMRRGCDGRKREAGNEQREEDAANHWSAVTGSACRCNAAIRSRPRVWPHAACQHVRRSTRAGRSTCSGRCPQAGAVRVVRPRRH